MPIRAFTMPIRLFTMTDPAVHDADPGVHDGPIRLFTMGRFPQSVAGWVRWWPVVLGGDGTYHVEIELEPWFSETDCH